jgi:uncharacterized protein
MTLSDPTIGSSVVITHRVKPNAIDVYEEWLNRISPICRSAPGFLDWHIVRPVAGLTTTYTVIIRFDSDENLRSWMGSRERRSLIDEISTKLLHDDDFVIRSGLDFWFTPEVAKAKLPRRWKQFLLTWSAIYPLVLLVPLLVIPLLEISGLPRNRYIDTLAVTLVVVSLMVYAIMPNYTKLTKKWLFR